MKRPCQTIHCFVGFIALAALAVADACATAGASPADGSDGKTYYVAYRRGEAKVTRHFDASVADTWRAIPAAFKDLNYAGGPAGKGDERLYMTPTLRLPGRLYEDEWNSAYFDCGRTPNGSPAAESYELSFAVLVWVDADKPSGSVVQILLNGWGRDRSNPSAVVECSGTGRLEALFAEAIRRRVNLAKKS